MQRCSRPYKKTRQIGLIYSIVNIYRYTLDTARILGMAGAFTAFHAFRAATRVCFRSAFHMVAVALIAG